jgi:5-methylcytosine-specific restriction protein B
VAFGVGSLGFANDYDIATLPWVRRQFSKLRQDGCKAYFKNDFSDIENSSLDLMAEIKENYPQLKKVIDTYKKVLPASQILDFSNDTKDEENFLTIKRWIATYALIRNWANKTQMKTVKKFLPQDNRKPLEPHKINNVLRQDKFVVLQGAPGTGKTFSALEVAKNYDVVHFEQFHAETSYSDFVYGIRPVLGVDKLLYEPNKGVLYRAIKAAQDNSNKKVLLIIDEINRANLSNVLGPVFYLFEKNQSNHNYTINIGDIPLTSIPENLFIIATMNTADRSLAVVDFALRRRFTWLTLRPHKIQNSYFQEEYYNDFDSLFQKYATDDELNLQPGQSYFIAKNEDEMKIRLEYEIMPLMKEYFNEGYLLKAKDEFSNYFYNKLGVLMYE